MILIWSILLFCARKEKMPNRKWRQRSLAKMPKHLQTPYGKYANINEVYQTYALANVGQVDADSKVTIPPEEDVKEAKDWVDYNEK